MEFNAEWLGPEFAQLEGLHFEVDAAGAVTRFGLRAPGKQIEVQLNPRQATTVELMDDELTDEEWLDGWRWRLIEEATPKEFKPTCAFCGKTNEEVRKLIAGPQVMICNECVDLCHDILTEETSG